MGDQDLKNRRRDREATSTSSTSALPFVTAPPPPPPPAFPFYQPAVYYPATPQQAYSYHYGAPQGNSWYFYDANIPWYGFQPPAPVPNYGAPYYPYSAPVSHAQQPTSVSEENLHVEHNAPAAPITSGQYEKNGQSKKKKGTQSGLPINQSPENGERKIMERNYRSVMSGPKQQSVARKKGTDKPHKHIMPVPKPTSEYTLEASEEPFVIDPPDRMLVILDLNGTLVYRPNARQNPTRMIARPFLFEFLRFLFDNFAVMVWSSAKPENVRILVENALPPDLQKQLVASWARDKFNLSPLHYTQKVQVYKDLHTVWASDDIQKHIPGYTFGKRFGQDNTILIDDSIIKASAQPHNLLEIPSFEATDDQMKGDVLKEVAGYLQVARIQNNVSSFMRRTPFKADGTWQMDWEADPKLVAKLKAKAEAEAAAAAAAAATLEALTITEPAVHSQAAPKTAEAAL